MTATMSNGPAIARWMHHASLFLTDFRPVTLSEHYFVVYRCQQCCNPATHLSLGHIRLCDRCVAAKSRDIVPHRHGGERCGCGADVRRPHGGISSDCLLRLKKGNRGCGEKYLGPRTDTISALEYVLLSPQEPHC